MINQFKTNFSGGTRQNRFEVVGNIPTGGSFTKFHIRSTIIPQLTTQRIEYPFFGRKYYYPAEKEYSTWSFNVLDDTGNIQNLWSMFNTWQNEINEHNTNKSWSRSQSFKADNWKIRHLNLNGEQDPLKEFVMHGCWPTSIEPMPLNMSSTNTLNSFNVVVVYDYIEITGITKRR